MISQIMKLVRGRCIDLIWTYKLHLMDDKAGPKYHQRLQVAQSYSQTRTSDSNHLENPRHNQKHTENHSPHRRNIIYNLKYHSFYS